MNGYAEKLERKIIDKTAVVAVVGLGYVGLPTALAFSEKGFKVLGVDKNQKVIKLLTAGVSHLPDLGIGERVETVIKNGWLDVTTNTVEATKNSDIIIITVPTPLHEDRTPDLSCVISAGEEISKGLYGGKLVILESTVYPGLTEEVLIPILEKNLWRRRLEAGVDFGVAHVPERYNPGDRNHSIADVVRVAGAINKDWLGATTMLYKNIVKDVYEAENIKTAEAAKIIENVQRDLNIALMNELALIFERMGIDVMDVIKAASTKWNFHTYYPGAGVGGHCLTKDGLYLVNQAKKFGCHPQIILVGRAVNDSMPYHVLDLLIDALNEHEKSLKNSKIVVLGLAYKENIGDTRESPSLILIKELKKRGAKILGIDPYVSNSEIPYVSGDLISNTGTIKSAINGADVLVLMTEHSEFKSLDLKNWVKEMRTPILIDGRRIFQKEEVEKYGFTYRGVGAKNT
jgi:nucleotide sugar dehydrogenase